MTSTPAVLHAADLAHRRAGDMLVTTTESIPGYRIVRVLGLVRGNTVRTRNVGQDFLAGLRNLVGGEVTQYTAMLSQSREQALDRMRAEALAFGANAIVGMRLTTATVMAGAAEILAYGTAVVVTPET
ncbi:MAG TPA: YbjQ family protein [Nannocystis sp.]